jgi:hypothetical protein
MIAVRQAGPSALGCTHASSVIPSVSASDGELPSVTRSSVPSNESAPPEWPAVVHVAPSIVPSLP